MLYIGRHAVIASLGLLCFAATVEAEESGQPAAIPQSLPPQTDWAGFYLGVNGGYGSSAHASAMETVNLAGTAPGKLSVPSVRGAFGGVQTGYNWRGFLDADLVVGVEGDLEYERISGILRAAAPVTLEARTSLNSFGTLRGRLGYAWDQALLFATAGLAFGDIENTVLYRDSISQSYSMDMAANKIGYVVGGGIGLSMTPNWSLKVEYQFLHLEGFTAAGTLADNAMSDSLRITDYGHDYQMIKASLDYRINVSHQSLK